MWGRLRCDDLDDNWWAMSKSFDYRIHHLACNLQVLNWYKSRTTLIKTIRCSHGQACKCIGCVKWNVMLSFNNGILKIEFVIFIFRTSLAIDLLIWTFHAGEMFTFGYAQTPPYITYRVISNDGVMHEPVHITVSEPIMMHDFAITENYAIFMDLPLHFKPKVWRLFKNYSPFT